MIFKKIVFVWVSFFAHIFDGLFRADTRKILIKLDER